MFHVEQQIGLYKLIRKLGKGGFGEVWLAERQSQFFTKKVAVKLPHDEQVDFETIKREAVLWEEASGHPNVLPIIDADVYDGQVVIVSEYADGGSLADKLKAGGKLPVKQAVEMTVGILNGLEYLHSKQIIHRDIKPQNILLQGNTPRLADFGISRAMNTSTISSVVVGTDAYMSPEAFDGKRNVQTDIWSVGVVLYQLLKGDLPFPQEHPSERLFAILTKEFETLSDDFPADLRRIVQKALAKQPEERYQSAGEMREDLQKALVGISHPTFAPTEILHKPIMPDLQSDSPTLQTDAATLQTNAPSLQTEIQPTQTERETEQFTRPAIETKPSSDVPSIVTQINQSRTDESAKPFPAAAQIFGDKTYNSRSNNKILYYAGAGVIGLVLFLIGAFAIFNSTGIKTQQTGNRTNSAANNTNASAIADKRLIPYKKGFDWGFVDENKKFVIEPKYNDVKPFDDGLALVWGDSFNYGFIDKTGKEVVPIKYDRVEPEYKPFRDGLALVYLNDKYGYVDKTGKEVIPRKYKYANPFGEGLAAVYDDKWQVIDKAGNLVITLDKYVLPGNSIFSEGLLPVYFKEKSGFIDKSGNTIIPFSFDYANSFSEGLAGIEVNNKYGFIDKTGKIIVSPKYNHISDFKEGLAVVSMGIKDGIFIYGKYGFIDKTGKEVIPLNYYQASNFSEGLASVEFEDNKAGFIDKTGKVVIPFKYMFTYSFVEGLAKVAMGKDYDSRIEFYIDKNGTEYYEP